ncbi:iron complex transport system substrate-binding protein [Rhizobium leguminosarum]|uniref:ABC transporter substrate-binding protein n=1 Tax=Rhizobium leguminosarum TaxID=384 RepID=UPI0016095303|nr:ABC transporter substrate-binding protein [Rhizobium leguminosarum]MBB5667273.1 iron complex transport system substrate-binding protein [Rhizobium leguminosarum]
MTIRLFSGLRLIFAIGGLLLSSSAWAERVVTDQIGRTVHIPDHVSRVVILQHQTLNITIQLDAMDKVVGVLEEWKKQLGANYVRLAPQLPKLATPGGLTKVNIEELLKLDPDVVFVTNYAPADMVKQIEDAGLPVVAISLLDVLPEEAVKLNPTVKDEPAAIDAGFATGVRLIADILDRKEQGEAMIAVTQKYRKLVTNRLRDIPEDKRVPVYMANPNLETYGRGKYTGLMMERAGAHNVAHEITGYKQVGMEDVLTWNPAVIFVQERYPSVVDEIKSTASWQTIDAVKNGQVYLMPQYAKAWGYPEPEAMSIGELWMAQKLYPDRFKDIDMQKEADTYYKAFFRTDYAGE